MGADLYESYVGSIIATMALGAIASLNLPEVSALQMIQVPVSVATIGVLCSIIGTAVVRTSGEASQHVLLRALRNGTWLSTGADRGCCRWCWCCSPPAPASSASGAP